MRGAAHPFPWVPPAVVLAILAVAASTPAPLRGQSDVQRLADACHVAGGAGDLCLDAALAVQAAHGLVGLAVSGGSDLPGNSSTLGKRLGSTPRLVLGARLGLVRGDIVQSRGSAHGAPESAWVRTVQGSVAAGLFDGFSVAPTVGGILSLDAFATAFRAGLPGDLGTQGSTSGFGLGVRLGIFRESFTLPGVTLSAARRWVGDVRLGDRTPGDVIGGGFDLTVTSVRATVGKELLGLAFVAGVGWDRYASDAHAGACTDSCDLDPDLARNDAFRTDRTLFFGSASYTLLILQLSAEGGYARGYDAAPGLGSGGYDPTSGSVFVRVGARLTL